MRRIITILILCVGIFTSADAQTFTQRIQKKVAGQGTVTIQQDSVIDNLVNSAKLGMVSQGTQAENAKENAQANTTKSSAADKPQTHEKDSDVVDNNHKMIRNGVKIIGYRVQAFAGGNSRKDRQKAEQIGNNIKSNFSDVPVYVHFYSPRWICRVGNYRTYEEAHQMLVNLRKLGYTQATIVKGKITVPSSY